MTHNPSQAEVQAAYDDMVRAMSLYDDGDHTVIGTLLTAVARDTLGWREVDNIYLSSTVEGTQVRATGLFGGKLQYWIKDPAP